MKTQILTPNSDNIALVANKILNSDIVAIPTETVYGLACNAFDEVAIKKVFIAKGRPADNPLIVHVCDEEMLKEVVSEFSVTAQKLAKAFWPGPLTMVLPKSEKISDSITCSLDAVGVRMPSNPIALELIKTCGLAIAAPSANVSGKPSPTSARHVFADFDGKIEFILDGGDCEVGIESTVIKVLEDTVEILRPGKISINDLLTVVKNVKLDDGVFTKLTDNRDVSSPGMKYTHYSPNANVIMVEGSISDFCEYVSKNADDKPGVLVFEKEQSLFNIPCFTYGNEFNSNEQAAKLFAALREIDKHNLKTVFARVPLKEGVGLAVYNRLLRACGFEIIKLKKAVIIGLTGQTGGGKTTLCAEFEKKGAAIINCDLISRDVIKLDEVINKLVDYFGEGIKSDSAEIDRKALAKLVFTNEENMIFLNSVMYPQITKLINKRIDALKLQGYNFIVLDAPTLFESKANKLCDVIISVISDVDLRLKRIKLRDNMSNEAALERINAQNENEFYVSKSDFVVENNGDLMTFLGEANKAIDEIMSKY